MQLLGFIFVLAQKLNMKKDLMTVFLKYDFYYY